MTAELVSDELVMLFLCVWTIVKPYVCLALYILHVFFPPENILLFLFFIKDLIATTQ